MLILGLTAFHPDSACCLLRDGEVVAKEIRELKAPAAVPGAGIREGS